MDAVTEHANPLGESDYGITNPLTLGAVGRFLDAAAPKRIHYKQQNILLSRNFSEAL
jgi:hypothetical protein